MFEDSDENKLEYTTLFERYTELTGIAPRMDCNQVVCTILIVMFAESLLLKKLQEALPDFDMEAFMGMVVERKGWLSVCPRVLCYDLTTRCCQTK